MALALTFACTGCAFAALAALALAGAIPEQGGRLGEAQPSLFDGGLHQVDTIYFLGRQPCKPLTNDPPVASNEWLVTDFPFIVPQT